MPYFTQDFINFFQELTANNNKEWFDENRKRYQKSVKDPFQNFVQEMIDRIRADDPAVDIAPKDAIFRINRDIRFSQDKTPYKTEVSALIGPFGKKNKGIPGFYIRLAAHEIRVYGGAHMLEKEALHQVRAHIANNMSDFAKVIAEINFVKKFGELHGEQNKRLAPELQEAAQKQPLIANKSFYYYAVLDPKLITRDALPDTLMDYYFAGKPVSQFFRKAMGFAK